jgi:hypothetical protein
MRTVFLGAAAALLAAASLPPAPAPAAPGDGFFDETGRPLPDDPGHRTKNGFAAMLLVVPSLDRLIAEWAKPETPHIETTSEIVRGEMVFGALFFAGCRAGADGNCKVSVTYTMTGPAGAPYGAPHHGLAWDHPPAPGKNFLMAQGSLGFGLDPPDPLGRYVLHARITDEVAGTELELEQPVDAKTAHRPPADRRSI